MNILHVMTAPRAEGTPRLVLDWLTVAGHQQDILFLTKEGELTNEFRQTGNWQYYNDAFELKFIKPGAITRLVSKVCRERKPDLVIAWAMGFSQWVHLGARLAGVKKLIVHAGNPPGRTFLSKYLLTYLTVWIGYILGNKVITCSNYIRAEYIRIPFLSATQFISVYNCFNPTRFELEGVKKNQAQAIMVATLEAHKDHNTLLHAWKILEEKGLPFRLWIAGDGTLATDLKKLKMKLDLAQVEFLGSRSDISMLLHQSEIFVLSTTRQEGFGTVLLEAMAAGCQVVASDVPACREILEGGKYGKLVRAADPEALAEGLIESFTTAMSDKGREDVRNYVQKFTPQRMLDLYLNLFDDKD